MLKSYELCDTYVFIVKLKCLSYLAFMACALCDPCGMSFGPDRCLRYSTLYHDGS